MRKTIATIALCLSGPLSAEQVVIAAMGDSLTHGFGLPQGRGFVPQLQQWLDDQGQDTRIINAGVSGDTTAGGLGRVAWTLTPDVDALIVALGGNDFLRGIAPEASRANLQGILKEAKMLDVPVLLVGMQAPGNYGPDYKAAFDSMYPELANAFGTLYLESFFEGLGGAGIDPANVRAYFQADGIHPNADGVARIVGGFGPAVLDLIAKAGD